MIGDEELVSVYNNFTANPAKLKIPLQSQHKPASA